MYEYSVAKVEKVVDGDTIDILFDLGFGVFRKERVRLHGIDTPESISKDASEKMLGREAKVFVAEWLRQQKSLKATTIKDDKYGRMLAVIHGDGGACLNEIIVSDGYAWKYDGGTKVKDFAVLRERREISRNRTPAK